MFMGVEEARQAAEQMARREGEYYRRWQLSMRQYYVKQLRKLEGDMGVPEEERTTLVEIGEFARNAS